MRQNDVCGIVLQHALQQLAHIDFHCGRTAFRNVTNANQAALIIQQNRGQLLSRPSNVIFDQIFCDFVR